MSRPSRPVLLFLGHHKCGTRWAIDVLGQIARDTRRTFAEISDPVECDDPEALARRHGVEILALTNAQNVSVPEGDGLRAFHIVRDPRDLVVSSYYSHRTSHGAIPAWQESFDAHRAELQREPIEVGLLREMECRTPQLTAMGEWSFGRADVLEMRLEEFAVAPYASWLSVFEHLDLVARVNDVPTDIGAALNRGVAALERRAGRRLPVAFPSRLPISRLMTILWRSRFEVQAGGRKPGEEDQGHHFRKGVPGDWESHFTDEHLREWDARFPGLVERMGYGP